MICKICTTVPPHPCGGGIETVLYLQQHGMVQAPVDSIVDLLTHASVVPDSACHELRSPPTKRETRRKIQETVRKIKEKDQKTSENISDSARKGRENTKPIKNNHAKQPVDPIVDLPTNNVSGLPDSTRHKSAHPPHHPPTKKDETRRQAEKSGKKQYVLLKQNVLRTSYSMR